MPRIIATVGPMIAQEKELNKLIARGVNDYWVDNGLKQSFRYMRLLNKYKSTKPNSITVYLDLPSSRCRHVKLSGEIIDDRAYTIFDEKSSISKEDDYLVMSGLQDIITHLHVGEKIYYEDGLCVFSIREINVEKSMIIAVCDKMFEKEKQSTIRVNSSISFDGEDKPYSVLRKSDLEFLTKCRDNNIKPDYIALSFCKNENDIIQAISQIRLIFEDVLFLVKIQTREAIHRIDSIIDNSDGIVIERGDLIYLLQDFSLPFIQKLIIDKAHNSKKKSVVANGFMSEYARASLLSRAEQSDVYRLLEEGADYILLTKETGMLDHPIATIDAINMIFNS